MAALGAQVTWKPRMWLHLMTIQHHVPLGPPGQEAQGYEFQVPPTPSSHLKNKNSLEKVFMFIQPFCCPLRPAGPAPWEGLWSVPVNALLQGIQRLRS